MTQNGWDRALTNSVAQQIRRRRGKQSVQWLSDRTVELGYHVSRSRLGDLERGVRGDSFRVTELLVLAKALGAQPIDLLFPEGETLDVLPEKTGTSSEAREWFTGEQSASAKLAAIRSLL